MSYPGVVPVLSLNALILIRTTTVIDTVHHDIQFVIHVINIKMTLYTTLIKSFIVSLDH